MFLTNELAQDDQVLRGTKSFYYIVMGMKYYFVILISINLCLMNNKVQSFFAGVLGLCCLLIPNISSSQTMDAISILENSIDYHDPNSKLQESPLVLRMNQTRPDGQDRHTTVFVALNDNKFAATNKIGEKTTSMDNRKGIIEFSVDGNKDPSPEEIQKFRLTEERFEMMHNYYRYLWFAPLILHDPGTHLAENAESTFFNGIKVWEIKVNYDPAVGSDIWYFYFDQTTYALKGYRFYHDESKQDGEYIILEGEVERNGIRIPASRKWYMHQDDKYLGNDILLDFEIVKAN